MHLVFVPQLLVELPHLIRFQVEDTEERLHQLWMDTRSYWEIGFSFFGTDGYAYR